jgi:drug/metabolite transporter (DMT)-like permease
MSLTGIALYYMGFNLALTFTTASQGALVQSSIPAVTAITAAIMLHERITRRLAIGIGLAIAGVFLIVGGGGDHAARSPLIGNAIMVGTVIVWAMYTVYAKRTAHLDPLAVTAIVFLIGTLMLVPAAVIEAARGPTPHVSTASWARIIYLAVFASAGGFMLYSRALRDLDASLAGVFVNMSPVIGAVSGVLLLHEPIAPLAIVGGVLVLAGLWLGIRGQ